MRHSAQGYNFVYVPRGLEALQNPYFSARGYSGSYRSFFKFLSSVTTDSPDPEMRVSMNYFGTTCSLT